MGFNKTKANYMERLSERGRRLGQVMVLGRSRQTYIAVTTSLECRCNVTTLQRRCNDVVATLCVCWVYSNWADSMTRTCCACSRCRSGLALACNVWYRLSFLSFLNIFSSEAARHWYYCLITNSRQLLPKTCSLNTVICLKCLSLLRCGLLIGSTIPCQ